MNHPLDIMYGDKLRELRDSKSQFWLATALGIKQPIISDYEQGSRHFTDDFITQVCNIFKISVREFKKARMTPTLVNFFSECEKLGLFSSGHGENNQDELNLHFILDSHRRDLEDHKQKLKIEQYDAAAERIARHRSDRIV